MALHDDIEQESRFGPKPERFVHLEQHEDNREGQGRSSNSFDNDRNDAPVARTDSFARALIAAWLVATFLALAMLLLQPTSVAPPGHSVGPSLVQAPSPSSAGQPPKPVEPYECSDLDYAYARC